MMSRTEMFVRKFKQDVPAIGKWTAFDVISHPDYPMVQECPHPRCWNYWNQVLIDYCPYCGTQVDRDEDRNPIRYKVQFTDDYISEQQGKHGLQWYKPDEVSP